MNLLGIHHITAIAGEPRRNVDFYTKTLGLRLVKKTVNFDDPTTYHLYYGDSAGTPGSILTFFPWPGVPRGRVGTGQASATTFSVPFGSLAFWRTRLVQQNVSFTEQVSRFGDGVIQLNDPDGLVLEILETREADARPAAAHPDIPAEFAIRGFHSVTLAVATAAETATVLTKTMNYRFVATEGSRTRYSVAKGGPGTYVDVLADKSIPRGLQGGGTVHHVAFRTPDDAAQASDRETLSEQGFQVSPVMDRNYFHSIYYREPQGILFEIATDPPGFAVDEPAEKLGEKLQLPPQYEAQREKIEAALPKLS